MSDTLAHLSLFSSTFSHLAHCLRCWKDLGRPWEESSLIHPGLLVLPLLWLVGASPIISDCLLCCVHYNQIRILITNQHVASSRLLRDTKCLEKP